MNITDDIQRSAVIGERYLDAFSEEIEEEGIEPIMAICSMMSLLFMGAYAGQGIEFTRALSEQLILKVEQVHAASEVDLTQVGIEEAADAQN